MAFQRWQPNPPKDEWDVLMSAAESPNWPQRIASAMPRDKAAALVGMLLVSPMYVSGELRQVNQGGEWVDSTE